MSLELKEPVNGEITSLKKGLQDLGRSTDMRIKSLDESTDTRISTVDDEMSSTERKLKDR